MYKLSVTLPSDEALERALVDDAYRATVHIDRAVQADLPRATPPVRASPTPLRTAPEPCQLRTTPPPGTGSGRALRSETASPVWPPDVDDDADELEDELAALDTADAASSADGGGGGGGRQLDVERQVLPFCSGLPAAELCAGSISFYRYAHPPGVLGLRPPPLRSNLIALLAVPAHLSTADLLMFVGGYLRCILLSSYSLLLWRHPVPPSLSHTPRYIRHMRLVRDGARQSTHALLLQFGGVGHAERFRADFHGRRFNSLEPEVALAVHVAQVVVVAVVAPPVLVVTPSTWLRLSCSRRSRRRLRPRAFN